MNKKIEKPKTFYKRDLTRGVLEAAAQTTPLTAALAQLYQVSHPSQTDQDRMRWEKEVTNILNELIERTSGTERRLQAFGRIDFSDSGRLTIDGSSLVTSVVDEGIGKIRINLTQAIDNPHFSANLAEGTVHVLDSNGSFVRVQTSQNDQAKDIPFHFIITSVDVPNHTID